MWKKWRDCLKTVHPDCLSNSCRLHYREIGKKTCKKYIKQKVAKYNFYGTTPASLNKMLM